MRHLSRGRAKAASACHETTATDYRPLHPQLNGCPCGTFSAWTEHMPCPKPGTKGAASGRWNSRNAGGNSVRSRRRWGGAAAAVSQWMAETRVRGREAWRAKPRPTGPMKRTPDHRHLVPELFSHGAEADGCRGACWTWVRVATGLWEACGVSSHQAHVSRLLNALQGTPQRPMERAAPRDDAIIQPWRVPVWPERNTRRASKGAPVSL
jgi:transposase